MIEGNQDFGPPSADAQQIEAEVRGLNIGTDPFVVAVRATRMPMIITKPSLHDNPVVFANNSFCSLTGYDREEILGRNCRFLQRADTNWDDVLRIREAIAAARTAEIDIHNHRKDGEPFCNRLFLAPVLDEGAVTYAKRGACCDPDQHRRAIEPSQMRAAGCPVLGR